MEGIADPSNLQFLSDVRLPFAQPDTGDLANRTQWAFYVGVLQTLDREATLGG